MKTLDWPQPLKDSQEYWIGKSQGAAVKFKFGSEKLMRQNWSFTTRPDTILEATFMVLAPENPLVEKLTTQSKNLKLKIHEETSKNGTW